MTGLTYSCRVLRLLSHPARCHLTGDEAKVAVVLYFCCQPCTNHHQSSGRENPTKEYPKSSQDGVG
jgi:hypothetical protein